MKPRVRMTQLCPYNPNSNRWYVYIYNTEKLYEPKFTEWCDNLLIKSGFEVEG